MALKHTLPSVMTLEQFLAWPGDGSGRKYELVDGIPRAMSPASATHGLIQNSIGSAFRVHIKASKLPCRAGTEMPVVPPMKARKNARVPDISVVCGPRTDSPVAENPVLIVEIMSPSNEEDTWESIRALAPLLSIREIMVVQSERIGVEVYRRMPDGNWLAEAEEYGAGETIKLKTLGLSLPISEIYEETHLAEAAQTSRV